MKTAKFPLIVLALAVSFAVAAAQPPRYVDRQSTDPGRDLERVSVKGKIERIDGQDALLRTKDGLDITVHLGPQNYWMEKGYHLRSGVDATVDGWGELYGEDGGYVFAGSIYGDGFYFDLADSRGYPRWADRDDWRDDWCPRIDYYEMYYWGPPHWRYQRWGPPPNWHWRDYHGPRWDGRHGRRDHRPGPPGPPPQRHGSHRGR